MDKQTQISALGENSNNNYTRGNLDEKQKCAPPVPCHVDNNKWRGIRKPSKTTVRRTACHATNDERTNGRTKSNNNERQPNKVWIPIKVFLT